MTRRSTRTVALGAFASLLVGTTIAFGCSTFAETATPGPASEAGNGDDGGGDGGVADSGPSFCERTDARFCDDFEVPPLGAKWPAGEALDAGMLSLVDGSSASPRYAVRAFLPGSALPAAGARGQAQLLRYQSRSLTQPVVIIDADLRVDSVARTKDGVLGVMNLTFDQTSSLFFVIASDGNNVVGNVVAIGGGDGGPSQALVSLPPLHTWFHARIEAHLVAGKVSLFIDGDLRTNAAEGVVSNAADFLFGLGAFASEPQGATELTFDNVVVTAR